MKFKKIKFEARDDYFFKFAEKPVPSIKKLPDWWRSLSKYADLPEMHKEKPVTVKQCGPTADALGAGYIISLWTDINVSFKNNKQILEWDSEIDPLSTWNPKVVSHFEIPEGFSEIVYKYSHGWIIKTPKNWSTLFINPIGYKNSPIRTIEGLVDTDILKTDINCPIVIKKDFEGIIKKGTPIAQIIPIKRANWKSDITYIDDGITISKEQSKIAKFGYGYYFSRRHRKIYK